MEEMLVHLKIPGYESKDPCQTLFSRYSVQYSSEESNMWHLLEPFTLTSFYSLKVELGKIH